MAGRGLIAGAEMALRAAGIKDERQRSEMLNQFTAMQMQQQMFKMQEEMRKAADEQKRQQAVGSIIGRYNPESMQPKDLITDLMGAEAQYGGDYTGLAKALIPSETGEWKPKTMEEAIALKTAGQVPKETPEQKLERDKALATFKANLTQTTPGQQEGFATREEAYDDALKSAQLSGMNLSENDIIISNVKGRYSAKITPKISTRIPPFSALSGMPPGWVLNRRTGEPEYRGGGEPPEGSLPEVGLGFAADKSALTQLTAQKEKVLAYEQNAIQNAKQVYQLSGQLNPSRIPELNRIYLQGKTRIEGDPIASNYLLALRTFVNEYARVTSTVTGGGVTSDQARKDIEDVLPAKSTPQQMQALLRQAALEMKHRKYGYDVQQHGLMSKWETQPSPYPKLPTEKDIYSIFSSETPNVVPPSMKETNVPSPEMQLTPGKYYRDANGISKKFLGYDEAGKKKWQ